MQPAGGATSRRHLIWRKLLACHRLPNAGSTVIISISIMLTRAIKNFAARIGIAVLLFAQLAVAAYACPTVLTSGEIANVLTAEDMHLSMPGCEEADRGNPNLCLEYSQVGRQAVATAPQAPLPAVFMTVVAVVDLPPPEHQSRITVPSLLPERESAPPPLLRFGFLRI